MAELVIALKGRVLRRVSIAKAETTIGRSPDNDVVLDNVGVSRHHATLLFERGGFEIRDSGSSNGLWVNGQATRGAPVMFGDLIQVGKFTLSLEQGAMAALSLEPVDPRLQKTRPRPPALSDPNETTALTDEELARFMAMGPDAPVVERPGEQTPRPFDSPVARAGQTPRPFGRASQTPRSFASPIDEPEADFDPRLVASVDPRVFWGTLIAAGVLLMVIVVLWFHI